MAIIGTLPSTLTNGTTADATQVMSDFNYIVSQVNANAASLAAGNAFTGTQTIGGDTIVTLSAAQTISGKTITGPNGTVGAPTYSFSGSTSTGVWSPATNTLGVATNGVNALYVDANQNVGLGVTPSAWSGTKAIEGTGGSLGFNGTGSAYLIQNLYFNGSSWIYKNAGFGGLISLNGGAFQFYSVVNGTAGSSASLVPTVLIDSAGDLLVGSTSANFASAGRGLIEVNGSSTALIAHKVNGVSAGFVYHDGTNYTLNNILSGSLIFSTVNTQRLVIDNIGRSIFAGGAMTTTNAIGSTGGAVTIDCSKSNVHTITLTSNMTGLTLSNIADGQTVNIQITQDGTGSRTMSGVTSANNYLWPGGGVGTLSTAAGAIDLLVITKVGTKFLTTLAKAFA